MTKHLTSSPKPGPKPGPKPKQAPDQGSSKKVPTADKDIKKNPSPDQDTNPTDIVPLVDKIQESAAARASFSISFMSGHAVAIADFVEEMKALDIEIDPANDESLATGIYALQKKLGFPEEDNAHGCDGKFGPFTLEHYNLFKLGEDRKVAGEEISGELLEENTSGNAAGNESRESLSNTSIKDTVFIGDSLAVGIKGNLSTATHLSKGGQQTSWMLQQLKTFLRARKSGKYQNIKEMVMLGGINDLASTKSVAQITSNLSQIYQLAKNAGIKIVACTVPKWDTKKFIKRIKPLWKKKGWGKNGEYTLTAIELDERTIKLNNWIRSHAPHTADLYTAMADFNKYPRAKDGLHMTGSSYGKMAQIIKTSGKIV